MHIQCTDVNTSVLTTFRSDNCNGIGKGGEVFAYAEPLVKGKRSVHQLQLPSEEAPNPRLKAYCWKYNILCKLYQRCNNYPCVSAIHSDLLCTMYNRTSLANNKRFEATYCDNHSVA